MTGEQKYALGECCAKWVNAEYLRRALKIDRAKACIIAKKKGIDIDYDNDASGHNGTYTDDRPEMQPFIERIAALDVRYRAAAAHASGLRSAMTRLCKSAGIILALPNTALDSELEALEPSRQEL